MAIQPTSLSKKEIDNPVYFHQTSLTKEAKKNSDFTRLVSEKLKKIYDERARNLEPTDNSERKNALKTIHLEDETSSYVQPHEQKAKFFNHSGDVNPNKAFARTLFETFSPSYGLYNKPAQKLPSSLYSEEPAQCGLPDGEKTHLTYEWVGHNTCLFNFKPNDEAENMTLLVDPNLSEGIEIVSSFKFTRTTPPSRVVNSKSFGIENSSAASLYNLGRIDVMQITHNHSDHCDLPTIGAIAKENPKVVALAPQGTGTWLNKKFGVEAIDHDWWNRTMISDGTATIQSRFVPAHHSSAGHGVDFQSHLWGGWINEFIVDGKVMKKVYVMGDTSCHLDKDVPKTNPKHIPHHEKMFSQISEFLDEKTQVICPIDPYHDEEETHMTPMQSAHLFTTHFSKVEKIYPSHFGAYAWGVGAKPDDLLKPMRETEKVWSEAGLMEKTQFLQIGEQVVLY